MLNPRHATGGDLWRLALHLQIIFSYSPMVLPTLIGGGRPQLPLRLFTTTLFGPPLTNLLESCVY